MVYILRLNQEFEIPDLLEDSTSVLTPLGMLLLYVIIISRAAGQGPSKLRHKILSAQQQVCAGTPRTRDVLATISDYFELNLY